MESKKATISRKSRTGELIIKFEDGGELKYHETDFQLDYSFKGGVSTVHLDENGEVNKIIHGHKEFSRKSERDIHESNKKYLHDVEPRYKTEDYKVTYIIQKDDRNPNNVRRWKRYLRKDNNENIQLKWREFPDGLDGKEVMASIADDVVLKIEFNGKIFTDKPARAPYNFIPLNKSVISSQIIPNHDSFIDDDGSLETAEKKRYSGYINLIIKNLTPFFIRGLVKKGSVWEGSEEFFHYKNNKPVIPGSSLRGLVRSLVEIVSWSEMEFVDKKKTFYYRGMADASINLRNEYIEARPTIQGYRNSAQYERNKLSETVGLLRYESGTYKIYPTRCIGSCNRNGNKFKYKYNPAESCWEIYPGDAPGGGNKGWKIEVPTSLSSFIVVDQEVCETYSSDKNRDESVPDLLECSKSATTFRKYILGTVNDRIIQKGIPVFFIAHDIENTEGTVRKTVTSFGYSRNYRIPYSKSIGEVTNQTWIDENKYPDFARAIFGEVSGNKNRLDHASRVYFEDGFLDETKEFKNDGIAKQVRILSSPKPTTFQHYLDQPYSYKTPMSKLQHYGSSGSSIRGYKNYWHKNNHDWILTDKEIKEKDIKKDILDKKVKVIEKAEFNQRIRFENLTAEELGAMLFVLDLPKECAHKLGLGKPFGLGSVRIEVKKKKITLINRKNRYEKLFNEKDGTLTWNTGEMDVDNIITFKNAFSEFICDTIGEKYDATKGFESLWQVDRMQQLKNMLTWPYDDSGKFIGIIGKKPTDWLKRTRYLEIDHPDSGNEYKNRPVLPNPSEVIDKDTYDDC